VGPGPFHATPAQPLFGAIGDSAPDRWGQALMRRAERRRAEKEDLQLADNSHVENLGGIGNGAHREFGLPGDAELNRRQLSTRTVSLTAKTTLHNPKTTLHNPKISSFFLEPVKVCPARFPKTAI